MLGVAADATVDDARRAIAAARRAFDTTEWSRDHAFRVRCLRQLHQALRRQRRRRCARSSCSEVGAPVSSTSGPQLAGPTDVVGWYADLLEGYEFVEDLGERDTFAGRHHRWIEKEAAGVVGAIAAYNYPIQLALAKLAPALAAGCTVVLKGAPDTPWATLALGKLIAEATDIPPGVVNVLTSSDDAVGAELTTHPDVDVVSFTGSTPVGRQIMAAASATVKRVFLELGGKSAFVLLDDGDLDDGRDVLLVRGDLALRPGVRDHVAPRRAARPLRRGRRPRARRCSPASPYGDPTDPANMMGPLINARQREKVAGYVDRAVADGAKAVVGGRIPEHLPQGLLLRADAARRRRRELRGRPGRALRSGARGAARTTATTTRCASRTTRSSGSRARC